MSMAQLRQLFVMESSETLQKMEDALLQLEDKPDDQEALNVIFRAIHTIKGSAGIVNLGYISDFAHKIENVLDKLRKQQLIINSPLIKLLLDCEDHLQNLFDASVSDNPEEDTAALVDKTSALEQQFSDVLAGKAPMSESTPTPKTEAASNENDIVREQPSAQVVGNETETLEGNAELHASSQYWHLSLRFHQDAYQQGVDPLSTLGYLKSQGKIIALSTIVSQMPAAAQMNPEYCYLGFEMVFDAENEYVEKKHIESLFELILGNCDVRILPPSDKLKHYVQLLQELPEDTQMLGEVLVQIGTLSEHELAQGLNISPSAAPPAAPVVEPAVPTAVTLEPMVAEVSTPATPATSLKTTASKPQVQATLKIEAEKLDQLLNQVGELVIANAQIQALLDEDPQYHENNNLRESVQFISRLVEDIRNSSLSMRMVQIGQSFNRLRRLVHDLSQSLGKQVELLISGADTELDKSMVEKIHDPLVHLIRNAIDHGIETIAERSGNGKSEKGHIYLNAYHESGSIVIEVSDDGRGLNREQILEKAKAKGLVEENAELSDQAIDNLIFEPGLSTSNAVTDVSGRGVGMDVVKRNLQSLNGKVSIYSETNQGTRVKIHFPLTLVIIDGFLVNSGDSVYVIPLDSVVECAEFKTDEENPGYIKLRSKALPLLYLDRLFNNPKQDKPRQHVIVVQYGGQEIGLVVDGIQGEFQAVIKPLGPLFENLAGINGATVLGNGEVALILDVAALVDKLGQQQHHNLPQNFHEEEQQETLHSYLIFSIEQTYYALSIRMVKQVLVGEHLAGAPAMPDFIAGLLTLEHHSFPVLDLLHYFQVKPQAYNQESSIVVLSRQDEEQQRLLGLKVQHLHQVISLNESEIDSPNEQGVQQHDYFVAGISEFKQHSLLILDVDKLLERPDLRFLQTV